MKISSPNGGTRDARQHYVVVRFICDFQVIAVLLGMGLGRLRQTDRERLSIIRCYPMDTTLIVPVYQGKALLGFDRLFRFIRKILKNQPKRN